MSAVHHVTLATCNDPAGRTAALPIALHYETSDPYTITLTFNLPGRTVTWHLARDLFIQALAFGIGGDTRNGGQAEIFRFTYTLILHLHSRDGSLIAVLDRPQVAAFLTTTLMLVPTGTETNHLDLDDTIARLLEVQP